MGNLHAGRHGYLEGRVGRKQGVQGIFTLGDVGIWKAGERGMGGCGGISVQGDVGTWRAGKEERKGYSGISM